VLFPPFLARLEQLPIPNRQSQLVEAAVPDLGPAGVGKAILAARPMRAGNFVGHFACRFVFNAEEGSEAVLQ
jgi:hypothetical protein